MNSPINGRSVALAKHERTTAAVWFGRLVEITKLPLLAAATLLTVSTAVQSGAPQLSPIQLSPEKRQLIGVQFATVEQKELKDIIQTTALVEADEEKQGYVQTRFAGWIRTVFVNQTYQFVRKGQPLFTIYSPDLVSAEQEYLLALDTTSDLRRSDVQGVAAGAQYLVQAALERLKLFGVSPQEISRLKRERTMREAVEIDSPMSGYVMEWTALPNKYVQPDARLYTIANLSTVWVYAAVYQSQIGEVNVGDPVSVTVDAYPGRIFKGRVDFIWQAIDPTTRTARVRCALLNPEALLKLGMYVGIVLAPRLGSGLVIPDSGVFRTGTHNIVFVDRGDGYLQPVEVGLGPHAGQEFMVLKGLQAGQRIVSSANFLVDSESQLEAALGTFLPPSAEAGGVNNAPSGSIEVTTNPSPPQKGNNEVLVTVRDPSGRQVTDAQVSAVFFMPAMPAMGMSAMRVEANARPKENGVYAATVNLESGGTWSVSVTANRNGKQIAGRQLSVSVPGAM
jgi:Cu(I)/Ag(I) efflux system membrane fusion protein/cobalt-zinc-cadmium efflux system membrane fusion protein